MAGLFSQPLYADVIPTRRGGNTADSSAKIESRLVNLGLTAEAAKQQVQNLNDDQAKYFAANPDRIQLVGQGENWGGQSDNLWWEWIFGIGMLAVAGAIIVIEVGKD
ncbi:MAG: hypothetical protein HY293_02185 [Planctomycetes bacterium]|nr:hypothetical protein [Planctomycetota bacterium]